MSLERHDEAAAMQQPRFQEYVETRPRLSALACDVMPDVRDATLRGKIMSHIYWFTLNNITAYDHRYLGGRRHPIAGLWLD
jgi:hypothetical protein